MLIGAFGTFTPLAAWGFTLVRDIAEELFGDIHHIHCNTVDELSEGLASTAIQTVVVTSDTPDQAISDLLSEHAARVICFLDEPEDAAAFCMSANSWTLRQALEVTTFRFSAISTVARIEKSIQFRHSVYTADVKDVVTLITSYLAGPSDEETLLRCLRRIIPDFTLRQSRPVLAEIARSHSAIWQLNSSQSVLIGGISDLQFFSQFLPCFDGKRPSRILIPLNAFQTAETTSRDQFIELCGPSRCLIWGPYIHLQKGRWTARVDLEIIENYSSNSFLIDVIAYPEQLFALNAELPIQGVFRCELPFEIDSISRAVEIRVMLKQGAIEGRLLIRRIELQCADGVD